jgi:hypothetical protein
MEDSEKKTSRIGKVYVRPDDIGFRFPMPRPTERVDPPRLRGVDSPLASPAAHDRLVALIRARLDQEDER